MRTLLSNDYAYLTFCRYSAISENIHPLPPPMDDIEISRFPRRTVAVYAGFQTPLIQNLEEFLNFAKLWISWNYRQNFRNLGEIHEIPVGLTKHLLQDFQCRPWGGGGGGWGVGGADIFWNIPLQAVDVSFMLVHCIATLCIVSFCHIWISCSKTKTCLHFLSLYVPVLCLWY